MISSADVVVLGAGLAGLAASIELRRRGVPHRVFERSGTVGGLAATTEEAGYRFDRTGHLLHLRDPAIEQLVFEVLPRQSVLQIDRRSVVWSHGVTTRYPFQANVDGLPKHVAYACVRDFVHAHFDGSPRPVKTFEDYCLRHFGEAISHAFMIPYNEKLLGVHPREIAASWCDRFVPRPSLDDVLRGAFGVDPPQLGYNAKFHYPRLGMGQLVAALAQRASVIETDCEVLAIDIDERVVVTRAGSFEYDRIVSTLPLPRLVAACVQAPEEVRSAAGKLRATRLHYLDIALNTPCEVPWHWAYVPEADVPFYRVGSYSNFSAAMAPTGKGSLYVELASRETPVMSEVLPRVADALIEMGVIRAREAIRFARARTVDPAYVLYDDDREPALEVIFPFLEEAGIASIGRYGAWEYSSMEDALVAGLRAGGWDPPSPLRRGG